MPSKISEISLVALAAELPKGVHRVNLPVNTNLYVLRQVRAQISKTELEELTESIKANGQDYPGIVACLAREQAIAYLSKMNRLWGTAYTIEEFEPTYVKEEAGYFYLYVIAGHRRLMAVYAGEVSTYFCDLHVNISHPEAMSRQYRENNHKAVDPDDDARFIACFWQEQKEENKRLTLTKFAKKLGKTPEVVRRALRFTNLPMTVQRLVNPSEEFKKGVSYPILCALARLQEERQHLGIPYSELKLIQLAYTLVAEQRTAKAVEAWVSAQIQELRGQGAMFELEMETLVEHARRTVVTGLESTIRAGAAQARAVSRFHSGEQPAIDKIASGSAVEAVARTVDVLTKLAPAIIDGVKGGRGAPKVRAALKRVP